MVQYVPGSLYYYAPNKGGPAAFAVLFFISGVIHFCQTWRYRSWTFTGIMPWASILLTSGFALREYGAYHYTNLNILIAESVLIMSGPPVYALINYLVLSRILYYVPYLSPIHPGRVLTTLLAADSLCEILIANGAVRIFNSRLTDTERHVGDVLVKTGLILQCVMFVAFIMLGVTFQWRARKAGVLKKNLKLVLLVLYISCIVVTARCIYRIAEFFEGFTGEVYTHEVYFYVFEATIMFINTTMLNIFHPGRYLPRSNKVFLAQDGKTELVGPGWQTKRSALITFIDPFDIIGICTGTDKKNRFWELSPEQLDELLEENRRKKEELKAQPRPAWQSFLDPLHIFGPNGRFQRLVEWMDGDNEIETNASRLHTQDQKLTENRV
jgi:RTA1 like protein